MGEAADAAAELRRVWGALDNQLERAVGEEADDALARMRELHFIPYDGHYSDRWLHNRRPDLSRSLASITRRTDDGVQAVFFNGSDVVSTEIAAIVNEFGSKYTKPIIPRVAEKMAIPIGAALDARGVRRYRTVRDARRDYDLVWRPGYILGRRHGDKTKGKLTLLYRRLSRTSVPARPFVRPELAGMLNAIERRVDKLFARVAA